MDIINIYENYNSYFSDNLKSIFNKCSRIASINNFRLYLVGGIVRDLLLGIENFDIDITVEGNAIEFCRILQRENAAKIISEHKPFATAKIEMDGLKIDFASTRSERYPQKGHLPVLDKVGCSLELDVIRRDFTINAMALSLNSIDFGSLFDYVGGYSDLSAKVLRVLHDKSFEDDPTRILRGLKFSQRFGFSLDEKTYKLQKEYLQNVDYDMSSKRLKNELEQCFNLNSDSLFKKFMQEKMYKLLVAKNLEAKNFEIENYIKRYKVKHSWIVYFAVLVGLDRSIIETLELTKKEKEVVQGVLALINQKALKDEVEKYNFYKKLRIESLIASVVLGLHKSDILKYLDESRKIKIFIDGNDLADVGIKPSKLYKKIFDDVLRQKLKNPQMKKIDEIEYVKSIVTIH